MARSSDTGVSLDALGRPLRSLRVSVTDRCNLRCAYCMPEEEYGWLKSPHILSFEELSALVDRFLAVGLEAVRLTGGEPLVRKDLPTLVRQLAKKPALADLALTTNGVLLAEQAQALKDAGLRRLTVSVDTLKPEVFRALTRRDSHRAVLEGVAAARATRFEGGLKLDTVVIRGVNDGELVELLDFAATHDAELRFIEYMDVGGATGWSPAKVVPRAELLSTLSARFGRLEPLPARGSAPAERFRLPDGRVFGIVASTTAPFCSSCDRARLTADGTLFTCLYAQAGVDLREALRNGETPEALEARLSAIWSARADRGAEERLALRDARGPLFAAQELRTRPHLEMHTRGG